MRQPLREVLLQVLEACRQRGTLHPRVDAAALGMPRDILDEALDHLRLGGFIEIDDWKADLGQGYRLTEEGQAAAQNTRLLDRPAPGPRPDPVTTPNTVRDDRDEALRAILLPDRPRLTPILVGL